MHGFGFPVPERALTQKIRAREGDIQIVPNNPEGPRVGGDRHGQFPNIARDAARGLNHIAPQGMKLLRGQPTCGRDNADRANGPGTMVKYGRRNRVYIVVLFTLT